MGISALILGCILLLGCVLLITGFVAGLWFAAPKPTALSGTRLHQAAETDAADGPEGPSDQRARIVSRSLLRLLNGIAGDVSAYSSNIEAMSGDLGIVEDAMPEAEVLIEAARKRILAISMAFQEHTMC